MRVDPATSQREIWVIDADRRSISRVTAGPRFLINTPRDEEQLPINVVFNWTSLLTER